MGIRDKSLRSNLNLRVNTVEWELPKIRAEIDRVDKDRYKTDQKVNTIIYHLQRLVDVLDGGTIVYTKKEIDAMSSDEYKEKVIEPMQKAGYR